MYTVYAGIHIPNAPNEILEIEKVDFQKDIKHLKNLIAARILQDADKLELICHGLVLSDASKVHVSVRPNSIVHCFLKTSKLEEYVPKPEIISEENIKKAQELLLAIANVQINIHCRVNILQKILAEYPEFRRDLGALILLRDSVLFNTLHRPEVVRKLAEHHPVIIEAAPLIVSTIKRELAKGTTQTDQSTDSTTSSDEESDRGRDDTSTRRNQSDSARLRLISRQQLEAALAEVNFTSLNSLANIAQRNSEASADGSSSNLTSSASDERISGNSLRTRLQRAFDSYDQHEAAAAAAATTATSALTPSSAAAIVPMDTNEQSNQASAQSIPNSASGQLPQSFQNHMYAEQLRTMAQMGFVDPWENLCYLNMANGNVETAINLLMAAMS